MNYQCLTGRMSGGSGLRSKNYYNLIIVDIHKGSYVKTKIQLNYSQVETFFFINELAPRLGQSMSGYVCLTLCLPVGPPSLVKKNATKCQPNIHCMIWTKSKHIIIKYFNFSVHYKICAFIFTLLGILLQYKYLWTFILMYNDYKVTKWFMTCHVLHSLP